MNEVSKNSWFENWILNINQIDYKFQILNNSGFVIRIQSFIKYINIINNNTNDNILNEKLLSINKINENYDENSIEKTIEYKNYSNKTINKEIYYNIINYLQ